MKFDPDFLTEELRKRGDEWADKDAAFYALEKSSPDILAECKRKVSSNEEKYVDAKAEMMARCTAEWLEHRELLSQAKREVNFAKVKYTTWQSYLELVRSKEATMRAEIQLT